MYYSKNKCTSAIYNFTYVIENDGLWRNDLRSQERDGDCRQALNLFYTQNQQHIFTIGLAHALGYLALAVTTSLWSLSLSVKAEAEGFIRFFTLWVPPIVKITIAEVESFDLFPTQLPNQQRVQLVRNARRVSRHEIHYENAVLITKSRQFP